MSTNSISQYVKNEGADKRDCATVTQELTLTEEPYPRQRRALDVVGHACAFTLRIRLVYIYSLQRPCSVPVHLPGKQGE